MAQVRAAGRPPADDRPRDRSRILVLLAGLFVVGVLGSAAIGSVPVAPSAILRALGLGPEVDAVTRTIILQVRLPRIVLAALVGAGLAASGTVFQGIFRNPMADPYIIGVSGGAALGATAAIVLGLTLTVGGISAVTLAAFAAALLVTVLVYRLAWFRGEVVVEHLLLAGVAVGAFLAAVISALQIFGGQSLQQVIFWLMGGFSGRSWQHVLLTAPYIAVGYAAARVLARDLNLLVLGDETARGLGVETGRARAILIGAGSLMAAAAVSVSGLIGFVGLVVPHLMRLVVGPDHRRLLPAAALGGAVTLLAADTLARSAAAPTEIPVGIVTAALGAPFFLYLLRRHRRRTYWS
ncbi:MAG TPA: iron chelate uptake ABC transporter family permease subunit [bacterium]|nr:iron chelate uptake ABC transporter family permease subunit [bacterium]